jgi:hypothetical protein
MQMGRILYFKIRSTVQQPLLQQQVLPSNFDGTNRNAEHPVTILKKFIEIIPNELML